MRLDHSPARRPWPRVLLLSACLGIVAGIAQACEMRVRRHPDPLVLVRMPNGELSGPQFETVKEVLRRMGCTTKAMDLPWARALSDLQTGALDILPGAHRRVERDEFALFSQSVWPSRNRLYMRRSDIDRLGLSTLPDLASQRLRLGLQTGVSYGTELERLVAEGQVPVLRAATRQGLWQMLARGRVDAVPADELSSLRELRQLGLDGELQPASIELGEEPSHTAFSRKTSDAAFVRRFDQTLQAMQRDGTLAKIDARFRLMLGEPLKR